MKKKEVLVHKLFLWYLSLERFFSTIICKVKMEIWGIEYGNGVGFAGMSKFFRCPESNITIGDNCVFNSSDYVNMRGLHCPCILKTSRPNSKILIGNYCGFSGTTILSAKEIVIDDYVIVGANVKIGDNDDHEDIYNTAPQSVHICEHAWIGMNSIILKGVTIGKNSVVGAGSIVTKDIPDNAIAVGVPCKVIKYRNHQL